MRSLVKKTIPSYLASHGARLRDEYVRSVNEGRKPGSPWRNREIRETLESETVRRCAYCDSDMLAVSYGHIEHKVPKSRRPDLVVNWDNLTLACDRCNVNKGDYYSDELPLLDPYVDDIDEHLWYFGELVFGAEDDDGRGAQTIDRLDLRRGDLAYQRGQRLLHVDRLHEQYRVATGDRKILLAEVIRRDFESGSFEKSVRSFLRGRNFPL